MNFKPSWRTGLGVIAHSSQPPPLLVVLLLASWNSPLNGSRSATYVFLAFSLSLLVDVVFSHVNWRRLCPQPPDG